MHRQIPLPETSLDRMAGGGLLDAEPGTFGTAPPRYIGETEKNLASRAIMAAAGPLPTAGATDDR